MASEEKLDAEAAARRLAHAEAELAHERAERQRLEQRARDDAERARA